MAKPPTKAHALTGNGVVDTLLLALPREHRFKVVFLI